MRSRAVMTAGCVAVLLGLAFAGTLGAQGGGGGPKRTQAPKLKVGEIAPDFDLIRFECVKPEGNENAGAKEKIKLSSYRQKQPVFVIFSSYT